MHVTRRSMLGVAGATIARGALARRAPTSPAASEIALRSAIGEAAYKSIAQKGAPGVSVAISRHGRLLLEDCFGFANLETATPVSPQSVFRIGSLSKQFTAVAALRLQEQGQLRLTDPVAKYLPSFALLPTIAIAELIHHTAGLHSEDEATSCPAGPDGPKSQTALASAIARQEKLFDFSPGTAWLYSNANYIVLGAIVEQVAGEPLATAMSSLVLERFSAGALAVDRSDQVVGHRASGYSLGDDGQFRHAAYIEVIEAGGAGSMRGTAGELVRWHQALIASTIVAPASFAFLTSPGRLRDGRLSSANRFSPEDANYGDVQYGGGLLLSPEGTKPRTISHNGFINGFSAVLETNLDTGLSFAVLANADVGPNLPFRDIRRAVRAFEAAEIDGRRVE